MKNWVLFVAINICLLASARAEDGYELWLRYQKLEDPKALQYYRSQLTSFAVTGSSQTMDKVRAELGKALPSLLGTPIMERRANAGLVVTTLQSEGAPLPFLIVKDSLGTDGFLIRSLKDKNGRRTIYIIGQSDLGALYGSFHFLRLVQQGQALTQWHTYSRPRIRNRILNHWDNLNRHVERGYSGISIWNWHTLPGYIDQRYIDYARANASLGINGTVLTNVNANAQVLTPAYLEKVAALAAVFRPYGIKVYLTARFSAPVEIGGLTTADPLQPDVIRWWKEKVKEIYTVIPDFGGLLVKANSEGQPGPQNYGRNHADGANMLADALQPYNGLVMWRAFVYSHERPEDRFKQAYNEFAPLDGSFHKNVLVQVKNGPIDFQPREPFSPLFGAMPKTPLVMEFQITQEYLGQATQLVYEAPLFKEVLGTDTYRSGKGSTVAAVIDGSLYKKELTAIAGVSNIGSDINWTGHPFGAANWYAFGRLAWDHQLSAENIAEEWIQQSFGSDPQLVQTIRSIMLRSYPAAVAYMTPLGLHHIMGTGHHYGPAPWVNDAGRADWNPVYYHRADKNGLGFDRTAKGSNALSQYAPEVSVQWEDINSCPDSLLLWFHHASWYHKMQSGQSLWTALCLQYQYGVDEVRAMQKQWATLHNKIDEERFESVQQLLRIQEKEATWWKNACLLYFQQFSGKPFPDGVEPPDQTLDHYQSLRFPYAPGNG